MKKIVRLLLYCIEIFCIMLALSSMASAEDELYIIGYNTTPGSAEEASLKELATRTGGQYMNATDATTPDQLLEKLNQAFVGEVIPLSASTQIPVPPVENSTPCDCETYDPFYDEPSDCYQYGMGCTDCYMTCYEPEKDTASEHSGSCDCKTYSITNESVFCREYKRDCSDCYSICNMIQ
jgi:hypothetical protein